MPKMKTHKGAKRRFHVSAGGKVLRTKGPKSHLRRNKSDRAKSEMDSMVPVEGAGHKRRIRRLIPYAGKYATRASRRGGGSKK